MGTVKPAKSEGTALGVAGGRQGLVGGTSVWEKLKEPLETSAMLKGTQ